LPILRPMSEVAGILSIQVGARGLEKGCGGRGVLLPGTADSPPGNVTVLGAGVAGRNAARIAAAIGANVTILDVNPEKLAQARREYAAFDGRRREFRELSRRTRERLKALYETPGLGFDGKERGKRRIMEEFRAEYAEMKARAGGDPVAWRGYDRWVREANNAFFGAQAAYDELVPGFEALFRACGGDWQRFYDGARQLAALPKQERHRKLKEALVG
jgi:predicted aminopeptidase